MQILDAIFQNKNAEHLKEFGEKIESQTPIIVYGAGNLGNRISKFLIDHKFNLVQICDKNINRHGTLLNGVEIKSIDAMSSEIKENAVWIIAIWSPMHSFIETENDLRNKGVKSVYNTAYLYQLYPEKLLPYYHFQTPQYFIEHGDQIKKVHDLWSDEESKKQFAAHIDCRVNLNFKGLPKADVPNQYFCDDIFGLTNDEVFVDIGAYDGDTYSDFCRRTQNQFKRYFALEPDPSNLEKLTKKAHEIGNSQIEILPLAIGERNEILKFEATGGGGAGISADGNIEVTCTTIDDRFFDAAPTFIKMDIEGAEMGALKGGMKTIEKYKPKLAVCIYHLPDDLWTLPIFIKTNFPFYNIYCRTHQYDGLDFVMYCIPKK